MRTTIIISNWNGKKLLEKNLPKVLKTKADEVIVIDDGSTDGSPQVLQQFKDIKVVINEKNLGFVGSVNKGVDASREEIVVLLNNDVAPERDFLKPLLFHFSDKNVFAVSANEPNFSWAKAVFDGFVKHSPGPKSKKAHISFWASGGSAAFLKSKWRELGGMDPIYQPFYWEDIDLSYRAWKRGWKIIWEPKSIVYHDHGATIEKLFTSSYRDYISNRNHLLFIWKNINSKKLFSYHRSLLLRNLTRGRLISPFLGALIKLGEVLKKRNLEKFQAKVQDEEIFKLFEK